MCVCVCVCVNFMTGIAKFSEKKIFEAKSETKVLDDTIEIKKDEYTHIMTAITKQKIEKQKKFTESKQQTTMEVHRQNKTTKSKMQINK